MYALRHQFSHLLSQVSSLLFSQSISSLICCLRHSITCAHLLDTCCVYHTHLANPMWVSPHTPMLFIIMLYRRVYKGCWTGRSFLEISAHVLLNTFTKNKCIQTPKDIPYWCQTNKYKLYYTGRCVKVTGPAGVFQRSVHKLCWDTLTKTRIHPLKHL